jgi:hypothetical protein
MAYQVARRVSSSVLVGRSEELGVLGAAPARAESGDAATVLALIATIRARTAPDGWPLGSPPSEVLNPEIGKTRVEAGGIAHRLGLTES